MVTDGNCHCYGNCYYQCRICHRHCYLNYQLSLSLCFIFFIVTFILFFFHLYSFLFFLQISSLFRLSANMNIPQITGCPPREVLSDNTLRVTAGFGEDSAIVTWTEPTIVSSDTSVTVNRNSGSSFTIGSTYVIYTYTFNNGNPGIRECAFYVIVSREYDVSINNGTKNATQQTIANQRNSWYHGLYHDIRIPVKEWFTYYIA